MSEPLMSNEELADMELYSGGQSWQAVTIRRLIAEVKLLKAEVEGLRARIAGAKRMIKGLKLIPDSKD